MSLLTNSALWYFAIRLFFICRSMCVVSDGDVFDNLLSLCDWCGENTKWNSMNSLDRQVEIFELLIIVFAERIVL